MLNFIIGFFVALYVLLILYNARVMRIRRATYVFNLYDPAEILNNYGYILAGLTIPLTMIILWKYVKNSFQTPATLISMLLCAIISRIFLYRTKDRVERNTKHIKLFACYLIGFFYAVLLCFKLHEDGLAILLIFTLLGKFLWFDNFDFCLLTTTIKVLWQEKQMVLSIILILSYTTLHISLNGEYLLGLHGLGVGFLAFYVVYLIEILLRTMGKLDNNH